MNPAAFRCKHYHTGIEHPQCFEREAVDREDRIGFLDIETDGLAGGDWNLIYSWALKELDGKITSDVMKPKEMMLMKPDVRILKSLMKEIKKYDIVVTWYGSRFDIPMILARLYRLNLENLWPEKHTIRHIDCYDMARKLKMAHRRLDSVEELLTDGTGKTRMTFKIHDALRARKQWAFDWVKSHNERDVVSTEVNFKRMQRLVPVSIRYL